MVAADPFRSASPQEYPTAVRGPVVCRRCGVVAPAHGGSCEVCKHALAETRTQAPSPGPDLYWVAVRCGFTCNSCRFVAPLDGLDADGAVECAQCGLRQRFDVPVWTRALSLAHDVGDLAGPSPEGRAPHPSIWIGGDNPYAGVGESTTFEKLGKLGMLEMEAAPGHPVCKRCLVPLAVSLGPGGTVFTQCGGCGDRATYQLPEPARALDDALVGVVAEDQRTDRPKAVSRTDAGVMALSCPGCGAPLTLAGEDRVQTCAFCKQSCMVPWRRITRMKNEIPAPEIWWLLFRGPSAKRTALEAPVVEDKVSAKDAAKKLLARSAGPSEVPGGPGVHEAPVPQGKNWPQIALTVGAGAVVLVVGYLIAGQ